MTQTVEESVLRSRADRREYHCNLIIHRTVRKTRDRGFYGHRRCQETTNEKDDIALDEHAISPTCSICLSDYKVGDSIGYSQSRKCSHGFHMRCILLWLDDNDVCPCCRNSYVELGDTCGFIDGPTHIYHPSEQQGYMHQRPDQHQHQRRSPSPTATTSRSDIEEALEVLVASINQLASATGQRTDSSACDPPNSAMSLDGFVCQCLMYYEFQNTRAQVVIRRSTHDTLYSDELGLRSSMIEYFADAIRAHLTRSQEAIARFIDDSP